MGKKLYRFAKFISPLLWPIYPVKTFGPTKFEQKRTVFVMNHTSGWDPVIWTAHCKTRIHFMFKAEFQKSAFIKCACKALEFIPVSRGEVDLGAIRKCIELLKRDEIIGIFPEGTRNKEVNTLKKFHTGAALLALKTQSPIRPFYVWDKYKAFHKNYIIVGDEFSSEKYYDKRITKEVLEEATIEIQQKVDELRIKLNEILELKGKKRHKLSKKERRNLEEYRVKMQNLHSESQASDTSANSTPNDSSSAK